MEKVKGSEYFLKAQYLTLFHTYIFFKPVLTSPVTLVGGCRTNKTESTIVFVSLIFPQSGLQVTLLFRRYRDFREKTDFLDVYFVITSLFSNICSVHKENNNISVVLMSCAHAWPPTSLDNAVLIRSRLPLKPCNLIHQSIVPHTWSWLIPVLYRLIWQARNCDSIIHTMNSYNLFRVYVSIK